MSVTFGNSYAGHMRVQSCNYVDDPRHEEGRRVVQQMADMLIQVNAGGQGAMLVVSESGESLSPK